MTGVMVTPAEGKQEEDKGSPCIRYTFYTPYNLLEWVCSSGCR